MTEKLENNVVNAIVIIFAISSMLVIMAIIITNLKASIPIELKDLMNEHDPPMVLVVSGLSTWGTDQIGVSHATSLNETNILVYLPTIYIEDNVAHVNKATGYFILKKNTVTKLTPQQIKTYIEIIQEGG